MRLNVFMSWHRKKYWSRTTFRIILIKLKLLYNRIIYKNSINWRYWFFQLKLKQVSTTIIGMDLVMHWKLLFWLTFNSRDSRQHDKSAVTLTTKEWASGRRVCIFSPGIRTARWWDRSKVTAAPVPRSAEVNERFGI